ncbi:isopentenyl-diphosphate Delta-isomerase [Angustibacter aerolatus]
MQASSGVRDDLVVLLSDDHQPIGTMPKAEVHTDDTPLHLAYSVYVFDAEGRFLTTRRAQVKRTFPGVWTNSCCGHPAPDETLADAARRGLATELSLQPVRLDLALPDFSYRATSAEGLVEHEVCPVFTATVDADPVPDPDEVGDWRWVDWAEYRRTAASSPWLLSPWSVLQVAALEAAGL